jgi:hypothetical protein
VFAMPPRKDSETGAALEFHAETAIPRLDEIEPLEMVPEILPYIRRERRALELLARVIEAGGPGFR